MKTNVFGALVLSAATVLLFGCNQNNPPPGAAPPQPSCPCQYRDLRWQSPCRRPARLDPAPGPEGAPGAPAPAPAP